MRLGLRAAPAILLLVTACRSAPSPAPPLPAPPLASASAAASAVVVRESPRASDPRWLSARDKDPLAKARLAVDVGAAELLAGVDDGGETADTALAALPFAEDAQIALGKLGEVARADAGRRRRVLAVILDVAGKPPLQREPRDPEGARRCGETLLALAADGAVSREDRVLAVSAARALAEHGYVDRTRIPADLDPVASARHPGHGADPGSAGRSPIVNSRPKPPIRPGSR
jgi:hypothetical protein